MTSKKIVAGLFLVSFSTLCIYVLTSAGHTPYDYFARLAQSFVSGRYWLEEGKPWLNELIPAGENRYYVPYAPMPALVLVPFVFVWGDSFYQEYLGFILGAGIVLLTMILALKLNANLKEIIWVGLTIGLGSIIWYMSSSGSTWYVGQLTAAFFLTAALVSVFSVSSNNFITGLMLGAAYLARPHVIFALPVFLYLCVNKDKSLRKLLNLFFGMSPFLIFNFSYNWIRFNTIFDKGYLLIPGVLEEPWFEKGLFSLNYVPRHLKIIFAKLPIYENKFPFILPSWEGMAIWLTTPVFVSVFRAPFRSRLVKMIWASILLISIVVFSHGTTGFAQFGYRFAVDFYPLLMFLLILSLKETGLKRYHWLLLVVGILVNFWGVIWINMFGWVKF